MADTFDERLAQARGVGLSPAFNKIASYIQAEPLDAAFSTAGKLAQELNLNQATVVRFAQHLDYSGWPELREELADRIVAATDYVTCTELVPRLLERRETLLEQQGTLEQALVALGAEAAWIDETVARLEAEG